MLTQYKESETLELKASFGEWREVIITLSAFANKKGGKIIVGFNDDSKPTGITVGKHTIENFVNKLTTNTDPILYPLINVKTFGLGEIVEIEISENDYKPVFAFGKAYIRIGKTNQKVSPQLLRELIKKYTLPDFDKQIIGSKISEFQFNETLLKQYFKLNPNIKKVNNAFYLCFSTTNTIYNNAIIKAARFKGNNTSSFVDMKDYASAFLIVVDQLIDFIKRHINMAVIIEGKSKHKEVWDYPIIAIREAITNAIVHRDYADPGNIQIRIFDSRIEIWSPGILPKEINIKNLPQSRSIPRNKEIARLFYLFGQIENWGTGFQRMENACANNGNPLPEYVIITGAFVVTFFKRKNNTVNDTVNNTVNDTVNDTVNTKTNILKVLSKNPLLTIDQLSNELNLSRSTVIRHIRQLKKENRLKRMGSDKSGHWLVNNE